MQTRIRVAVIVGAVCGTVAGLLWGTPAGAGVGILVSVLGVTAAVLHRNRRDLEVLQRGGVPEPVERALGDDARP
jgi:uncharacterized membrane protein YoaK (UPF0700 family)